MSGNTIGRVFRLTTWGESHGPALGAVVDGCPPGIELDINAIQRDLDRRRPGQGEGTSPRSEADRVEILSGLFEGRTTGTPLSMIIRNRDHRSDDYESIRDIVRPGHGDYGLDAKYGIRDYRGGGRVSGRETAARVAGGAVAKQVLALEGISCRAVTIELGGIGIGVRSDRDRMMNRLTCPDHDAAERMEDALRTARSGGDTLGGIVEITVRGCPAGLGEPVFDKIDADLAKALMSIGTVKAVEIGAGRESARMKGSACNDPLGPGGFLTNHAGGILAGITTGAEIVIRVACRPVPTISLPQDTIDRQGRAVKTTLGGRHDTSVIPRILPVCEAMAALVLADHLLRQRALGRAR